MQTQLIYSFILFGATFFALGYEKISSNIIKKICFFMAFAIPFVFLALRYDIGTDYQNYVRYFERITSGEVILKEPGYLLVNKCIDWAGLDVQWLFVFFGFFFLYFAYKALPKQGFAVGVFLLISIMYLYEGFSNIRQGLAVAIFAYALPFVYKKQLARYVLWAVLAMQFHLITGILLLAVYPFANVKINRFVAMAALIMIFFIVQFTPIVERLFMMVASLIPRYAWYLNSQFASEATTSYGLIGPLIKVSIVIFVLFFKDKVVRKFPEANPAFNLYVVYAVAYIFHLKISIFGRLEHAFVFYAIIALTYFIVSFRKEARLLMMCGILLFYYAMFIRYIANGTLENDNHIYINPYQTIFSSN